MTITTIDGGILGVLPLEYLHKVLTPTLVAGRPHSSFYLAGIPGPAVAPTPGVAGAALTSYAGQMPFPTAVGGETIHLAGFSAGNSAQSGTVLLCDRLWHNSGLSVTLTTGQTVNSVAWPARDDDASTNGAGVYIGVEVSTATGATSPTTLTVAYTNSAGTAGRSATHVQAPLASSAIGAFYQIGLQAGDVGVRSVQTYTQAATWTSGTIHLVAYRILAALENVNAGVVEQLTLVTSGMPRLWDNTVPFFLFIPNTTTTTSLFGTITYTQG